METGWIFGDGGSHHFADLCGLRPLRPKMLRLPKKSDVTSKQRT